MARRMMDKGWFYVDITPSSDAFIMHFRMWHPVFWWHFIRGRFKRQEATNGR